MVEGVGWGGRTKGLVWLADWRFDLWAGPSPGVGPSARYLGPRAMARSTTTARAPRAPLPPHHRVGDTFSTVTPDVLTYFSLKINVRPASWFFDVPASSACLRSHPPLWPPPLPATGSSLRGGPSLRRDAELPPSPAGSRPPARTAAIAAERRAAWPNSIHGLLSTIERKRSDLIVLPPPPTRSGLLKDPFPQ